MTSPQLIKVCAKSDDISIYDITTIPYATSDEISIYDVTIIYYETILKGNLWYGLPTQLRAELIIKNYR